MQDQHYFDLSYFGAQTAIQHNQGKEWLITFLQSSGNPGFANTIQTTGYLHNPIKIPLTEVQRICGPEEDMLFPEEREIWEKRVGALQKIIQEGWIPPPLVVWRKDGIFSLADGAHRHEAMRRLGYVEYEMFVWCKTEEEESEFSANDHYFS